LPEYLRYTSTISDLVCRNELLLGVPRHRFSTLEPPVGSLTILLSLDYALPARARMRILIITDSYYPSTKAAAKLVHDLAIEFRRRGHDVIVAAPGGSSTSNLQVSGEDGLTIARLRTGRIKGACHIMRGIQEARVSTVFWQRGGQFFYDHPCDGIVFYSPSIFFGRLVKKLKSLWGCPAYLILRDIFPQWAVDAGVLKKGLVYSFFRQKEFEQYDAADFIGVQSPANLEYFAEQSPQGRYRVEVLYNWTTLDEGSLPPSGYGRELGLQGKTVFVYGGNMGIAQDMDNILRLAIRLVDHPNIYFLLVGEGSEVSRLNEFIAGRRLQNIRILPAVGQREYLSLLSEFDIGLISLDKGLKTHNFPGKLLGYLYCSLPVLASINPGNDLRAILEESEAGLCCLNGEDEVLKQHALALANSPALRKKMSLNGRRLLEQTFSVSSAARQILSHFRSGVLREFDAGPAVLPAS